MEAGSEAAGLARTAVELEGAASIDRGAQGGGQCGGGGGGGDADCGGGIVLEERAVVVNVEEKVESASTLEMNSCCS